MNTLNLWKDCQILRLKKKKHTHTQKKKKKGVSVINDDIWLKVHGIHFQQRIIKHFYDNIFFSAVCIDNQCIWKWFLLIRFVSRTLPHAIFEPRYDKTNIMAVRPAKTQISLGIRPVWSESSLSAWRDLGSLAIHWAHSEDSDQTGLMPRLIWVHTGRTIILLVLSWGGSFIISNMDMLKDEKL